MNQKYIRQLKNYPQYFIHSSGFVFKTKGGKDIIIKGYKGDNNIIYIEIEGKQMNLLYLMVEYFLPKISQGDILSHSVQYGNQIPLNCIKITNFIQESDSEYYNIIKLFKCKQRADAANSRDTIHKINAIEVAHCLVSGNMLCHYCGTDLNVSNWHLDHFIPISRGGLNKIQNLVCSCYRCNTMKNNLNPKEFLDMVLKISNYFKLELNQ